MTSDDGVRVSVVLPRDLVAALDHLADANHRSRAGEIRHVLQQHADRHAPANRGGARDGD